MKPSIPIFVIMLGGLFGAVITSGCATKTYVRKQVDPVSGKLDQVATKSDQQGQTLDQTNQSLGQTKQSLDQTRSTQKKDETKLSATNERAVSAGNNRRRQ